MDAIAEEGGAGGVKILGFVVFVDEVFELLEGAVEFGTGHGWGEVVDNDGLSTAFGLGPFAGVVDNEGV